MEPRPRALALAVSVATLALVSAALAGSVGTLAAIEEHRDPSTGGSTEGVAGAESVAESPDGRFLYVAAIEDATVVTFARDLGTGRLTPLEEDRDPSTGGSVEGLGGASGVVVSPDGRHAYVSGAEDSTVVSFRRDRGSGTLTRIEEDRDPPEGSAEGLGVPEALAIAPDGDHVYVASLFDSAVVTFERNRRNGRLHRVEQDRDPSAGGKAEGLAAASGIAVSPDGRNVYVTGLVDDAVVTFARNSRTGRLTRLEEDRDPSSGGSAEGLDGATGLAVSSDGRNVYVPAFNDSTVVSFKRKRRSGRLVRIDEERDPSTGGDAEGIGGTGEIAVAPDGHSVHASGFTDGAIVSFVRDPATGTLTKIDEERDPSSGGSTEGLEGSAGVGVSLDNRNVYSTSRGDDTVIVFARDSG